MKTFVKNDLIIWILLVTVLWYLFVFGFLEAAATSNKVLSLVGLDQTSDGMKFIISMYLGTIVPFIGILVYTGVTKRNRFVLRSFLPGYQRNGMKTLLQGLLVGFIMNFGCIVCALVHGDIKIYYDFALSQIPLMLFALVCVFIQSTSEELWCRGFIYERVTVRYPLWVAIVGNGVVFGALHSFNDGITWLAMADLIICGLSFSLLRW